MSPDLSVIDLLRAYSGPRGLAVALLFVLAALIRLPAVVLAVAVHVLERCSARLLAACNSIPPQPDRPVRRGGDQA